MNSKAEQAQREQDVLDELRLVFPGAASPAVVCRGINLARPCEWCPVDGLRYKSTTLCATVPKESAARVTRILKNLVRQGRIEAIKDLRGRTHYKLKEQPT
jgi:hypothetical protein